MAIHSLPRLDKTAFSVRPLAENDRDEMLFWFSKTPEERLEALETMRRIIYGYDPITSRLQRVLELTQRT